MTIGKGEAWGTPGSLPEGGVVVHADAEARTVVEAARRAGAPLPVLGLLGGDLCRTVGGAGDADRLRSTEAHRLPVDLGAVVIDGRPHWFVAHLVVRRSWWWGPILAAMNAQFHGVWDVAPRSHPNDGLLDTFEVTMSTGERLKARSRLASGSHLPHPGIRQRRVDAVHWDVPPGATVYLDGVPVGRARTLDIRVEPDALTCVV
jgi:diacylglycerol kinase family enzyme